MRATQGPKRKSSWSPFRWDRRRRKSRIGHRVLNGSTIGLLPFYRWRGGIVVVERVERGAYRGYGTLPANSRQSPCAGPRGLMCLRLGTSYRRIKCAHQGGAVSGGRVRQGRTRSQGGRGVLEGAGAWFTVGATESAGGRCADTGAGATTG